MLVSLFVESGRNRGKRVWLRENEQVTVGGTDWSDFSIRDSHLEEIQFELKTDRNSCQLHAQPGASATFVNGRPVSRCKLRHGDVVVAGDAKFRVAVEEPIAPTIYAPGRPAGGAQSNPQSATDTVCGDPHDTAILPAPPVESPTRGERATAANQPTEFRKSSAKFPSLNSASHPSNTDDSVIGTGESFLVVIRLESGPFVGRKIWLRNGEAITFGRTEWADYALPFDAKLADVHFSLEVRNQQCWIEALSPLGDVLVNSRQVQKSTVHHGDVLQAGDTCFRIAVEGLPAAEVPSATGANDSMFRYTKSSCTSGLIRYQNADNSAPLGEVVKFVRRQRPMYLVVNYRRAGLKEPTHLIPTSNLLAASDKTGRNNALLLLGESDGLDMLAIVERAKEREAAVGVFSQLPKAELIKRLSRFAASFSSTSTLASQATDTPSMYVEQLLSGVDAVLMPGASGWTVLADPKACPDWPEIGFPNPPV